MNHHPLAEKYPPMGGEEFAAFKADIAANGCREPVRLYEGMILDGRHRDRACRELGVEPPTEEFAGTPAEAAAAVDSWNLHRRHLTAEFRRQRVQEMRAKGMSTRDIAEKVGADHSTVARDIIKSGVAPATAGASAPPAPPAPVTAPATPAPATVKGRDGKQYPATRPKPAQRAVARGVGIRHAEDAINALKRIPVTDPLRDEAFVKVMNYLKANRKKPPPVELRPEWADVLAQLAKAAAAVESMSTTREGEDQPWKLIESLESTAAVLLRTAKALRRRHHL